MSNEISKSKLKKIVEEELERVLSEQAKDPGVAIFAKLAKSPKIKQRLALFKRLVKTNEGMARSFTKQLLRNHVVRNLLNSAERGFIFQWVLGNKKSPGLDALLKVSKHQPVGAKGSPNVKLRRGRQGEFPSYLDPEKGQAYATAEKSIDKFAGKKKPKYKSSITYGREMSAYGKNRGKWQAIYLSPLAVNAAIGFAIYEFKRTAKKYQASGRFYSSQVPIIKRNLIPVLNEMKRILQTGGDLRAVLERVAPGHSGTGPDWKKWISTAKNMNPAQQRSYFKMAIKFIKTGKI